MPLQPGRSPTRTGVQTGASDEAQAEFAGLEKNQTTPSYYRRSSFSSTYALPHTSSHDQDQDNGDSEKPQATGIAALLRDLYLDVVDLRLHRGLQQADDKRGNASHANQKE